MNAEVTSYYNQIAHKYDADRFDNSYGKFIDRQEKSIVAKWLSESSPKKIIDIGCGTGRFLEFAEYGHDISSEMISVALAKFPNHHLSVGSATEIPHPSNFLEAAISFHVMMHLEKEVVTEILQEAHRILKPGGKFIFDLPSAHRRKLVNQNVNHWHGANAYRLDDITDFTKPGWHVEAIKGILFLPIHRFPHFLRSWLLTLDSVINGSFLKRYSSYWVIQLKK